MQRAPSLVPLSRDHHVALTWARRLELAADEGAEAAVRRCVDGFRTAFHAELEPHFALEEEALAPLAEGEERRRLIADHAAIRAMTAELSSSAGATAEAVRVLGRRLHDHVRWEERELFPALERRMSSAESAALGARTAAHEARVRDAAPEERDRAARDVVRAIDAAWVEGRLDLLGARLHEDMVMALPGFSGSVVGRDAVLEGFREFTAGSRIEGYERSDEQLDVIGDTAVATHRFELRYEREGERLVANGRDVWVLSRRDGEWRATWRTMLDVEEHPA